MKIPRRDDRRVPSGPSHRSLARDNIERPEDTLERDLDAASAVMERET